MSRLFVPLIVIAGLAGCRSLHQPAASDHSSNTSHVQELLLAKGGPRILTMNLGGGRVDALPDAYNRSKSIPGFVSVSGIRITEGDQKTVGITLSFLDSTSPEEKEDRAGPLVNMDAEDALDLRKAMQQEIDYVLACMKSRPKHQGDMIWISREGLAIAVSSNSTGADFFTLTPPRDKAYPDFIGLSLSLEAGRQLMAKVDDALNAANASD